MAMKKVFMDQDSNEMDCYQNEKGDLYLGISRAGEDICFSGYITLKRSDVKELIKELQEIVDDINED
jgi:hypothetical protein